MNNYVQEIYAPFTPQEISDKMVDLLKPKHVKAEVQIVYQSITGLHQACPNNTGDWYFTGNYPTPGGVRAVNQAYIDWYENINDLNTVE